MDIQSFIKASGLSDGQLAMRYGFDRSYWAHVRLGDRQPSRNMLLAIWLRDHKRVGKLAMFTDAEVSAFARLARAP
jgi:hypothetical protein